MKTQDALSLLIALEERVARVYFHFFRSFRDDPAVAADSLGRALELAIRLESSELDVLGHRILQSLRAELPEGAARPFTATDAHCHRLVEAAEKVADSGLRQRLDLLLGGVKGR